MFYSLLQAGPSSSSAAAADSSSVKAEASAAVSEAAEAKAADATAEAAEESISVSKIIEMEVEQSGESIGFSEIPSRRWLGQPPGGTRGQHRYQGGVHGRQPDRVLHAPVGRRDGRPLG